MADTPAPTDAELDGFIRPRLALIWVDLTVLDPTRPDPGTGSPSQQAVLQSLRSFPRSTPPQIGAYSFAWETEESGYSVASGVVSPTFGAQS